MENNNIEELLENLNKLPGPYREATIWIINHFELALEICSAEELSSEQREDLKNMRRKRMTRCCGC